MADPAPSSTSKSPPRCLVADLSSWGRIRMRGKDRQDLLHRLSTNDIDSLRPGEGCLTVLLNTKGRILDLIQVMSGDADLLLITSRGNGGRIRGWLDGYIFREDASVEEERSLSCLGLFGKDAAAILARLTGFDPEPLPFAHHRQIILEGLETLVMRTFPLGGSGFLLFPPASKAKDIHTSIAAAGALPASEESLEPFRVAAGIPELGRELTEEFNPWEAALDRAISLTKGCYLGQEVVARLHTYKKVQRRLALLEIEGEVLPEPGEIIRAGGEEVGRVTSAALSPDSGRPLALGFLRIGAAAPGVALTIAAAGSDRPARLLPLPFLDSR